MEKWQFDEKIAELKDKYEKYISKKNEIDARWHNGIYDRYINPVLTAEHIPLQWRYDMNYETNPYCMERISVNAIMNSGAIYHDGKYMLAARVEGVDRKSYFAVCASDSGIDNFRFEKTPIVLPKTDEIDINVYDMRLTKHEDGYIYGLFCTERKDTKAPHGDTSSAVTACGIVRTTDFVHWERLKDLKSKHQQRNVTLHPEFVNGKYALYTRPSDGFIDVGGGGGIGFTLVNDIRNAAVYDEKIIDRKIYHTIKEVKNGAGAAPIKTKAGWLHIAHGVRNTCIGLRYVLYCFITALDEPSKVIYSPAGHFLSAHFEERIGDLCGTVFSNGAIAAEDGSLFIYYSSADTRLHVVTTTIDRMIDYCVNTPADGFTTHSSVQNICSLIERNEEQ